MRRRSRSSVRRPGWPDKPLPSSRAGFSLWLVLPPLPAATTLRQVRSCVAAAVLTCHRVVLVHGSLPLRVCSRLQHATGTFRTQRTPSNGPDDSMHTVLSLPRTAIPSAIASTKTRTRIACSLLASSNRAHRRSRDQTAHLPTSTRASASWARTQEEPTGSIQASPCSHLASA